MLEVKLQSVKVRPQRFWDYIIFESFVRDNDRKVFLINNRIVDEAYFEKAYRAATTMRDFQEFKEITHVDDEGAVQLLNKRIDRNADMIDMFSYYCEVMARNLMWEEVKARLGYGPAAE